MLSHAFRPIAIRELQIASYALISGNADGLLLKMRVKRCSVEGKPEPLLRSKPILQIVTKSSAALTNLLVSSHKYLQQVRASCKSGRQCPRLNLRTCTQPREPQNGPHLKLSTIPSILQSAFYAPPTPQLALMQPYPVSAPFTETHRRSASVSSNSSTSSNASTSTLRDSLLPVLLAGTCSAIVVAAQQAFAARS